MLGQVLELSAVAALLTVAAACQRGEKPVSSAEPKPAQATISIADGGPSASGDAFEVTIKGPDSLAAGSSGELELRLVAREGFHVNAEYPHNFRPDGGTGIAFESARYELKDGLERTPCSDEPKEACVVRTRVPFKATQPGNHRAGGVLAFSVCNPDVCLIEKIALATTVSVR